MHGSDGIGKMHVTLCSALQDRLTAGLCHCRYTCGDWPCIQVRCDRPQMRCSTCFAKVASPLSMAEMQNRLTVGLFHCKYTCEDVRCVQVYKLTTNAGQLWCWQIAFHTVQCCFAT